MTIAPDSLMEALDDRYRLLDVIGTGGMATVYRAHDGKHDRTVALKVLHDDLAATLGPERFKREIRIAARLQHPHILSVFDSGESAGRLWFTMPYVNGESLRDRLRRVGTLPVDVALAITREAAQALAYAHKQGVIHRDIKPENILLTEDGSTLVADFGIARAIGDSVFDTGVSGGLTQTGLTIGTPTYMAPEQATGESVLDERVDQYALAAVLYEMLTGTPPFTGSNAAALIAARFTTAVTPLRQTRTEVPTDVDRAVQRALSLKAFDRFPTISAFAQAVAPPVTTPPQFQTLPPMRAFAGASAKRRGWGIGVAVAALVAVAVATFLVARRSGESADARGPIRIAVLPFQNLGDSTDVYFADGMADELRAKLLKVPGMQVIARSSSNQYARTTKTPEQIGKELGVRYLLTGTIRWERGADGRSIVHLRPELMQVGGQAGAATTRWQQAFDQPLTDVLPMQATIAEQVASQLQVTLGTGAKQSLTAVATSNAEAYDAYLRGMSGRDDDRPATTRRRMADLQRAVALDSSFIDAWSQLTLVQVSLFRNTSDPAFARLARQSAQETQARAPGTVAAHIASASYLRSVANDDQQSEAELRKAQKLEPGNVSVMTRLGVSLMDQGRFDEAFPLLASASRLDPLNGITMGIYGVALMTARRPSDARAVLHRASLLTPASPNSVLSEVTLMAQIGDLQGARAIIRDAYSRIPAEALDVFLSIYNDYGWLLDDAAQLRVLAAPLAAFDDDPAQLAIVRAQIHRARGDSARAREFGAQAAQAFRPQIAASPDDAQLPHLQAFAFALAGRPDEARRALAAAAAVTARVRTTRSNRVYFAELRARIHVLAGEFDGAFDEIEKILAEPGDFGRGHLKLDPMWAPLRSLPRYQRIMSMSPAPVTR